MAGSGQRYKSVNGLRTKGAVDKGHQFLKALFYDFLIPGSKSACFFNNKAVI